MRWLGFEANLPAWSAAALLQRGTYTAPPIRSLVFFQWVHTMIALRYSKMPNVSRQRAFLYLSCILIWYLPFETRGLFTCACATRLLAAASIRERRLFHSACPEVRRQFESGDHFFQHVQRCGDNSRAATNRERCLIEQIRHIFLETKKWG